MRKLRGLLLLIATVFLPLTRTQTSECTDFTPSMDARGEPSNDLTATTRRSLALVLTNYTFSCNGFLNQWNIHWELENVERCEIVMDFRILRPTKTADFCGLVSVASTQVILTPPLSDHPGRQTVISSFSVSDSVRVETGDLVGLVVMFSDSERCPPAARVSVLETSSPGDPDLVYLAVQASEEDDLELGSIAGFGCDDSSSDESDKTGSSFSTSRTDDTQTSSARRTPRPVTPRPDIPRPVTPRPTPRPDTSSRSSSERDSSPERSGEEDSSDDERKETKESRERSKRTHSHNHFKVYHGAPLINAVVEPEVLATATVPTGEPSTTVPSGEPSTTVPSGEPRDQEALGSGELEEEEGAGLRGMMIPAGVVVGVLAVGGVGAVVVALACCLCYRAKQRHSQEGDFNISDNKAYSSTSATSPLGHSKEEKATGRKPPVKPRPRYSMSDNTAYSTYPETWGAPQHHPTPHYITPKLCLTPKTGDSGDTREDHLYVVDGKIYEMPSQM